VRFLLAPQQLDSLAGLVAAGEAAHRHGLDGVLLTASEALPAPLVSAAALAARVGEIRIAVEVEVGDRHPLELAEEAAVVDVGSGGRLILAARPAGGREDAFGEALDLLRLCFAARPFRFEGEHWRVPAGLPQNVHNPEHRIRATPPPAQPRLELWGAGAGLEAALTRGLGILADADADPAALAGALDAAASPASLGAPRGRREGWSDAAALVARLRDGRAAFGQDWAAVSAPPEALVELASVVRPRVQLDRLPPGLEAFWDETRPWTLSQEPPPTRAEP
jgi:alkanesulfonate monooxygenase SsuD/methylene tetrahydromethanopterin reductase-like flavin-dependent oxidoreductase (luciferase family)